MTLVTITEAAERAVVHPQTIRRWIREARLCCHRIDGVYYVHVADVLEVERERRAARIIGRRGARPYA